MQLSCLCDITALDMKTHKGKLVVVEGADGSGKGTQVSLLIDALQKRGTKVTVFDFPQYETSLFGEIVGKALKGAFGDFKNMSPYLASLPFTLDRLSAKEAIVQALRKGVVICNRYTPSNVAYQAAKFAGKEQKEFISFLEQAEYGELGLPRPDMVMYLYVPPAISYELVKQKEARSYLSGKKGAQDQHESDRSYQDSVVKTYLKLAKQRVDWNVITCTKKGKLLSREEIHDMVMSTFDSSIT